MLYRCQPDRCRYTVGVAIDEVHAPTSGTTVRDDGRDAIRRRDRLALVFARRRGGPIGVRGVLWPGALGRGLEVFGIDARVERARRLVADATRIRGHEMVVAPAGGGVDVGWRDRSLVARRRGVLVVGSRARRVPGSPFRHRRDRLRRAVAESRTAANECCRSVPSQRFAARSARTGSAPGWAKWPVQPVEALCYPRVGISSLHISYALEAAAR